MVRLAPSALAAAALAKATVAAGVLDMPITFRRSYALVSVEVGTPAEEQFLRFDTGSATTWIIDKECARGTSGCEHINDGTKYVGYNLSASSTGRQVSPTTQIDYLGGVVAGPGVADVFRAGDLTWNQTFLNVHQNSMTQQPDEGFLGLSFDSISENETHTVPATMLAEGMLAEPRMGLYYGRELFDTAGRPGEGVLTLGGSHEERYVDGDVTWVPVIKGGDPAEYQLWRGSIVQFEGSHTGTDGGAVTDGRTYGDWYKASGVFDTGAGNIFVPSLDAHLMYSSIGWDLDKIMSHEHIPLCTEFNSSWSMTFTFEGDAPGDLRNITLTGDMLARPGYANRDDACTPPFAPGNDDGFFLFGTPLLVNLYTIFDFGAAKEDDFKPRVGFGRLKEEFKAPL